MSTCTHTDVTAFHSLYHNFDKCHLLLLNLHVGILVGRWGTVFAPQLDIKFPDGVLFCFKKKKSMPVYLQAGKLNISSPQHSRNRNSWFQSMGVFNDDSKDSQLSHTLIFR